MRSFLNTLLLCTVTLSLAGCGKSGSSKDASTDFDSSALVSISTDPSTIDIDDITQITIDISKVNSNGVALKVRFPDSLSYIPNTSAVTHNTEITQVAPAVNAKKTHTVYLVYYLARAMFGDSNQGQIQFQLKGIRGIVSGMIEVDPDVDDPAIDNSTEFDINNPHFEADDSADITIVS